MSNLSTLNFLSGGNATSNSFFQLLDGGLSSTSEIKFLEELDAGDSRVRIKNKISSLIQDQFPEYIQTEYSVFVDFIEAYYRFLEKDLNSLEIIQNLKTYNDIDQTTQGFVSYFLKNYLNDVPTSFKTDKRFLIKRIKDLYESKGSNLSFDTLFRIFFNESVTTFYPYENVLRASDGVWEQRVSIRVETVSGSRENILNRFIAVTINEVDYFVQIKSIKTLTPTITEIFLDERNVPTFSVGDVVRVFNGRSEIFRGIVRPTANRYRIQQAGKFFKVGQYFNIKKAGAIDTTILVTGVNSEGGITKFIFINYGYGFSTDFITYLNFNKNVSESLESFDDVTHGFIDEIFIVGPHESDSADRYFDTDYSEGFGTGSYYTGGVISSSIDSTATPYTVSETGSVGDSTAIIIFSLGAIGKYPGGYTKNKGFLSDPEIRLQDGGLYQPYAYQTQTELDIKRFLKIVTDLIHPAGSKLYNNRTISANIDLSSNVLLETFDYINLELFDDFTINDQITSIENLNKNLFYTSNVTDVSDIFSITQTKVFGETLVSSDSGQIIIESNNYAEDYFAEFYVGAEEYF